MVGLVSLLDNPALGKTGCWLAKLVIAFVVCKVVYCTHLVPHIVPCIIVLTDCLLDAARGVSVRHHYILATRD